MAQSPSIFLGTGGGGSSVDGLSNIVPAVGSVGINLLPTGAAGVVHIGAVDDALLSNATYQGSGFEMSGDATPLYPWIILNGIGIYPTVQLLAGNGTLAAPTAALSGDTLGYLSAAGYGTTGYASGPDVTFVATQDMTDAHAGSKILIHTIPNGSLTSTVALTIDQDQSVKVGGASANQTLYLGNMGSSFANICGIKSGSYVGIADPTHGVAICVDATHSAMLLNEGGIMLRSTGSYGWTNSATDPFGASNDTELVRGAAAQVNVTAGDGTTLGVMNAASYKAGGTAGVTAGPFTVITGITVKGGIVTALTGS